MSTTTRRKKLLITAAVALVLVVLAGAALMWWATGLALYTPGMVRAGKNLRGPLDPPPQTGDGSRWRVEDDIELAYTAAGEGRPLLVLHGGPGYPARRLDGLRRLAAGRRVICYDQRGCGRSTRPFDRLPAASFYANMKRLEGTLGVGAQVADVERIRRILGEEKLVLLGHSFGAFLAAMYAAEFPERVEALVLVAPAGVLVLPDETGGFFEHVRQRLPAVEHAEYDRFLKEYFDFGLAFRKSEAELASMNRRVGEYYLAATGQGGRIPEDNGGWMVQAMYLSMGRRHDYRAALGAVRVPALVVHGESDLMPERVSRMYAECLPNARLRVVQAGHFPFDERPEAFAEAVNDFLAGR
jgi:proline iminopeptidase